MKKQDLIQLIKECHDEILKEDMYSYEQKALRQQIEMTMKGSKLNDKEKLMVLKSILQNLEGNSAYTERY